MDASLYYTFSTIAQTLSAAIALLAAFALFRLQGLNAILAETSLRIEEAFEGADHGRFQELRVAASYDDCRAFMRDTPAPPSLGKEPVLSRRRTFEGALETVARVKSLLYWSLVLTVAVIVGSLVVLTRTPAIAQLPDAPYVLASGVVGTAICLTSYVALIRAALS